MVQRHRKPPDLSGRSDTAARKARTNPYARGLANKGNREVCHNIENKSSCRTARSDREHASLALSLQLRRQDAVKRSLAADPMEAICRELGGAKSWL